MKKGIVPLGIVLTLLVFAAPALANWNVQLSTVSPDARNQSTPTASPAPELTQPSPYEATVESITQYKGAYRLYESSSLKGNKYVVDVNCVVDSDPDTAWCEGAKDDGIGEWIKLLLADGKKRELKGFRILNGYTKSDDVFSKNSRVREIELMIDGVSIGTYELVDSIKWQKIDLKAPASGSEFKFVIRSVYRGSNYSDTCISEIELY